MASAALQITNTVEAVNVQRDKDHYHPTGDSVIQVESTLFKIHKFPLMHNSPIFATIFDLPVGLGTPEGLSDDFPIVLEGEKADEFRALLKYTSAPPLQAQVERMTEAVLPEIISLVKLSHKYQMDHWKDWGLEVLVRLLVDLSSLPAEHLQPLYSLYSLLEDIPARIRMMKHWCQVINSKNLSIVPVIDAAEKWGNRDSLAEAYCMQIRRWEKKANILDPKSYSEDGLSPAHIQRIQSGWMSLSLSWSQFRSHDSPYRFADTPLQSG
ncbi:hypothetical protein C8R45DRAFT_1192337 [Mycena sanguinolenta]|nr:hypothetical protein C8R45DRAFT_1192337 [Mycena sanguinolenta]